MIYVGIDVAKDKHDCFITNSYGEVLFKAFTIPNNLDGFNNLYQKIESVMEDISKVKVGLEYYLESVTIGKFISTINSFFSIFASISPSIRLTNSFAIDSPNPVDVLLLATSAL